MSFLSSPSKNGTYRIKRYNQNIYIQSVPKSETHARYGRPWLWLTSGNSGEIRQEWKLIKCPGTTDEWKISSCFDDAGLKYIKTYETYHGYGFPMPSGGDSINWKITNHGAYSTISAPENGSDVFDAREGDDCVHFWRSLGQGDGPNQLWQFELVRELPGDQTGDPNDGTHQPGDRDRTTDIVFLQDATASQQPYIDAARDKIEQMVSDLQKARVYDHIDDIRFRLVAFRDYPPQDNTFVTQPHPFTSNFNELKNQLSQLKAVGGGDGPEAQAAALDEALNSQWRNGAKMVVLITDSPPHEVEDYGDAFADGDPQQKNPLAIVDRMNDLGINLYVFGCEPTLSNGYVHAHDFYKGLVNKTARGRFVPLPKASQDKNAQYLTTAFVGVTAELSDTHSLANEHRADILAQSTRPVSDIVSNLHSKLSTAGVKHHQVSTTNVYADHQESEDNIKVWTSAKSIKEAKTSLRKVPGARILPQYQHASNFEVWYDKGPITRDHVEGIVHTVLKKRGGN